jgi:ABC-2 type transport system permease protein
METDMTALSVPPTAIAAAPAAADPRWTGSSPVTQVLVLTGRALRALRDPRMLVMSLLQPLIMLTLFSQVFRGIAASPGFPAGVSYIDYLMPAILVTTGAQAAMWSGGGLANDLRNGALTRFRSLPISMLSVLAARSLYDLVRSAIQLVILAIAATVLFGFAPAGGVLGTVAAIGIGLTVGWGMSWLFLALASWLRNVEVMQMVGFVAIFPLMFASSAYVPISSLPGWLQVVATINPLTYAIDAARGLALATPLLAPTAAAVLVSLALAGVGAAAASRFIRTP